MPDAIIPLNQDTLCDTCGASGAFIYTTLNKNLCPTCSETAAADGTLNT